MAKLISELAKELYVTDAELFEFFEELVSNGKLKPCVDIAVKDLPGTIWRYDYIGEQHDAELNDELAKIVHDCFRSS